jgi:formylglycine-generating enzyme required for sulfatase activity
MATSTKEISDVQKSALVQQIISGAMSLEQACARHGLSTEQLKDGVRVFRRAVRQALDHQLRSTLSVQGLDVSELSRAELSGSLTELAVADLLQTIQMGGKDVHISITHAGGVSELWCREGEVVDARSGSLHGEAAFYRVMAIDDGRIVADFVPTTRARRIELSTPLLLLKAASSKGLRARLRQRLGDPAQVFVVATAITARRAAHLEADEIDVLSLFDGVRTVEEVVFASGLPDARALEIVAHFREQRLLVPSASRSERAGLDRSTANPITMSYGPLVSSRSRPPEAQHPSKWMLASGALLCSTLGAISAIALANARSDAASSSMAQGSALVAPPAAALTSLPRGDELSSPGDASNALLTTADRATLPSSPASGAIASKPRCPSDMAWIEPGRFHMGSDSDRPAFGLARPAHPVSLRGFCLDLHEVTVAAYTSCVDSGECSPAHHEGHFAGADLQSVSTEEAAVEHGAMCNAGHAERNRHPINCVSQLQASHYCEVHGSRLPTEAEWEFAARGPQSRRFPWGDEKPTRAHLNACGKECARWQTQLALGHHQSLMYSADDGYPGTAPVGSFPLGASPEGVVDLIGNVFEWTRDGLYDYDTLARENPRGPLDSESVVIRGGNFNSVLREFADPALRFGMDRESYSHGVGFRCAADRGSADAAPFGSTPFGSTRSD